MSSIDYFSKTKVKVACDYYIVPDVVGTIGMSSASVGMDHGIWN